MLYNGVVHASFNSTDIILEKRGERYCMKLVDLDSTTNLETQAQQPAISMIGEGTDFEYMSPELYITKYINVYITASLSIPEPTCTSSV